MTRTGAPGGEGGGRGALCLVSGLRAGVRRWSLGARRGGAGPGYLRRSGAGWTSSPQCRGCSPSLASPASWLAPRPRCGTPRTAPGRPVPRPRPTRPRRPRPRQRSGGPTWSWPPPPPAAAPATAAGAPAPRAGGRGPPEETRSGPGPLGSLLSPGSAQSHGRAAARPSLGLATPAAPRRRQRHREPAVRPPKRRGGGSWQGPSCQLLRALGAHVTSRCACALVVDGRAGFGELGGAEGFVGNVRREPPALGGEGASSHRHLCGGFCWSRATLLIVFFKEWISWPEFHYYTEKNSWKFFPDLAYYFGLLLWKIYIFSASTIPFSWGFLFCFACLFVHPLPHPHCLFPSPAAANLLFLVGHFSEMNELLDGKFGWAAPRSFEEN